MWSRTLAISALLLTSFSLVGCATTATEFLVKPDATLQCVIRAVDTPPEVKTYLKKSLLDDKGRLKGEVPIEVQSWLTAMAAQQNALRAICASAKVS